MQRIGLWLPLVLVFTLFVYVDLGHTADAVNSSDKAQSAKLTIDPREIQKLWTGDLDPNVWFHNVEYVAADRVGAETVTYVSNIYKYYIAYQLIIDARAARKKAAAKIKSQSN